LTSSGGGFLGASMIVEARASLQKILKNHGNTMSEKKLSNLEYKIEFVFFKQSIEIFNCDLARLAKFVEEKETSQFQVNDIMQLLETVKENIEFVEKKAQENYLNLQK